MLRGKGETIVKAGEVQGSGFGLCCPPLAIALPWAMVYIFSKREETTPWIIST